MTLLGFSVGLNVAYLSLSVVSSLAFFWRRRLHPICGRWPKLTLLFNGAAIFQVIAELVVVAPSHPDLVGGSVC